jgi:hypothetical protein
MGFAGHNRGKKLVSGDGYVAPPTKPKKPCYACGSTDIGLVVVISVRPIKTRAYCSPCGNERNREEESQ